jgi:hypothetical protein
VIGKPRPSFEGWATASGPPPGLKPSQRAAAGEAGMGRGTSRDGTPRSGERLAAARRQLQRRRVDPKQPPVTRPDPPPPRQQNRSTHRHPTCSPAAASPTRYPAPRSGLPACRPHGPNPQLSNLLHDSPNCTSCSRYRRPALGQPSFTPGLARPGFTWQVEEGESGAKRRTPLPPRAQAGHQRNTQRRGGGLLRSREKPIERNRWRETQGGKQGFVDASFASPAPALPLLDHPR